MPQCQFPVFCCFCVSEKLHRKYSRNWTKQVRKLLFYQDERQGQNRSRRGARGWPHNRGARPSPWPRPPIVRPCWSTSDDASSPIRSLPTENPKTIGKISRKSSAAPPPQPTNFGGQKSLFRHPAETGKCPRSHLHRSPSPSPPSPSTSPHLHQPCCLL
jgi:hypothetical protein